MGGKASKETSLWDPAEMPMEEQLWPDRRTLFDKPPAESTEKEKPVVEHPTVADADADDERTSWKNIKSINNKHVLEGEEKKQDEIQQHHQKMNPSVETIYRTDKKAKSNRNNNINHDVASMADIVASVNHTNSDVSSSLSNNEMKADVEEAIPRRRQQQQRDVSSSSRPKNHPRHLPSRRESHGLVQPMMPPMRDSV